MKKSKKGWTAVAGLIMAAAMAAGCNSNSASENPSASGSPAAAKKLKVTMFNTATFKPDVPVPPLEKDVIRQMIEKKMNIELNMIVSPNSGAMDKLNTLVASGQTPDLIHFHSKAEAVNYHNQGITVSLDDLLKDAPKLQETFNPSYWNDMKYKGETIGIPGVDGVGGISGWWINNDWLKKLNLKAPTNPAELLEVMKAFTFNDPDGNGKPDTYGFVAGLNKDGTLTHGWQKIFWMFGVQPGYTDLADGKVVFHNVDPRMKEAIEFANQIIEAKVIDPDWVTMSTGPQLDEKMYKGKVGVMIQDWRRLEPEHVQKMKDIGGSVPDWQLIPPPVGPHGDQILDLKPVQNSQWAISSQAAKDPEKAKRIVELLEYMYTDPEAYPVLSYGVKDVTWKEVDGKPVLTDKTSYDEKEYDWKYHYAFVRKSTDPVYFDFKNPKTDEFHNINLKYLKENKLQAYLVKDPQKDPLSEDRGKYMNEMILKFMTGKEPLSKWDEYLKTLQDKFKLDNMYDAINTQLKSEGILK